MTITLLSIATALAVAAALNFTRYSRSLAWRAMVTPLASIIGSGFLICGPLLAKEFGSYAILAEALLLAFAYAVGSVIRFNIAHVEPVLAASPFHGRTAWLARINQLVLAMAYAVSIAYYLKLLAEFCLQYAPAAGLPPHALLSNLLVSAVIVTLAGLVLAGDLQRIEHLAHATVSVKLAVIVGMLVALAIAWALHGVPEPPPPGVFNVGRLPVLMGLLITVQGFETSRYMGHAYAADVRIRAMRHAQWLSAAIYAAYLVLLTPHLAAAARTPGVAGILEVMGAVAPLLGIMVLVGSVSSQLSAAVADSIGAGGLISEVSRRRLSVKAAFVAACALAVAVVWLTDPFQVVAAASRAFAAYYALQCALAFSVSRRGGGGGPAAQLGLVAVGVACAAVAAFGAPAE